jgi:hypothetical protein
MPILFFVKVILLALALVLNIGHLVKNSAVPQINKNEHKDRQS